MKTFKSFSRGRRTPTPHTGRTKAAHIYSAQANTDLIHIDPTDSVMVKGSIEEVITTYSLINLPDLEVYEFAGMQ